MRELESGLKKSRNRLLYLSLLLQEQQPRKNQDSAGICNRRGARAYLTYDQMAAKPSLIIETPSSLHDRMLCRAGDIRRLSLVECTSQGANNRVEIGAN